MSAYWSIWGPLFETVFFEILFWPKFDRLIKLSSKIFSDFLADTLSEVKDGHLAEEEAWRTAGMFVADIISNSKT